MNFQQLRSVREAIRSGFNLTEAANALFTSQPGVSRQIRELEEELGVEIFERTGKRLTGLTAPGRDIARIIERLLQERDNLRFAAEDHCNRSDGRLIIATTHTQARYVLPAAISRFRALFPDVTLALQQASPQQVAQSLREGRADIGFASGVLDNAPDFVSFKAYSWSHRVLVPVGHPLAAKGDLQLDDIVQFPIVTYEEGFTGRRRIDQAFHDAGLSPNVVLTAMDADVMKTYVRLGLGIGILAEVAYEADRDQDLVLLHQFDLIPCNAAMLAVRKGVFLRNFGISFINLVAADYSEQRIREMLG